MFETGHFSNLWRDIAVRHGLVVDYVPGNWRRGAQPADAEPRLKEDSQHAIKAVMVVHNETSTGVASRIAEIRSVLDRVAASRAADGGYDLIAGIDGLPP